MLSNRVHWIVEWLQQNVDVVMTALVELLSQRTHDEDFSVRDIERQLATFYVDEGNDWTGRGMAGDVVKSATIAATEAFLARVRSAE